MCKGLIKSTPDRRILNVYMFIEGEVIVLTLRIDYQLCLMRKASNVIKKKKAKLSQVNKMILGFISHFYQNKDFAYRKKDHREYKLSKLQIENMTRNVKPLPYY